MYDKARNKSARPGFLRLRYSNVDERPVLGTLDTPNPHTIMKMTFSRLLPAVIALAASFLASPSQASVGDIYETNEGSVLRFKPTGGQPGSFISGFTNPKGLVFDGNGHLYVADPGKDSVIVFTVPDASGTTFLTNLNSPSRVAFDPSG